MAMNGPAWFLGASNITLCGGGTVSNTIVSPVSFQAFTDGTSNTACFSEMVKGTGTLTRDGLHMIYSKGPTSNCQFFGEPNAEFLLSQECQNKATTFNYAYKGKEWSRSYMGGGGGYTHTMPPNKKTCVYSAVSSQLYNLFGASSYHPRGVSVAFYDGSIRFVKNSVNYDIWRAIATKAGGEVVSADAL